MSNPLYTRRLMMASNGSPIPAGCEIVVFEVSETTPTVTVPHTLGAIPKVACCFGIYNADFAEIAANSLMVELLGVNPDTGQLDITQSGAKKLNQVVSYSGSEAYYNTSSWTTYPASMTAQDVTFVTGRYYNARFNPGVKFVAIFVK